MEHNPIAMQHYPSDYDPLHSEKSYSTPKLVAENNAAKHPLLSRYQPSKFENISKADDVICERPLLPKLSTKTGRNQKI